VKTSNPTLETFLDYYVLGTSQQDRGIIGVVNSRSMRYAEFRTSMGDKRNASQILVCKPDRDWGVDMRIILKWTIKKYDVRVWTGCSWFRIGKMVLNFLLFLFRPFKV
jgi:hypothetical protein